MATARTVAALLALWALPALAEPAPDADSVLACAGANAPEKAFSQSVQFDVTSAEGNVREIKARILGQRSSGDLKLNFRVSSPNDLAGTAALIREQSGRDELYIYLPALRRTRRVTGSMAETKLFGTDFSYVDVKQVFGAFIDGEREYAGEAEAVGRQAHKVRVTPPAADDMPYGALVAAIDQETCVPLHVDFLDRKGASVKQLVADPASLFKVGDRHLAKSYTLTDSANGSRTHARFSDVEYESRVSSVAFDPSNFQNAR